MVLTSKRRIAAPAIALFTALVALVAAPTQAQVPSHVYDLNGSFADALGGPSMNPAGGSLATQPGGYTFTFDQGPNVSGALANPSVYSIEMYFRLNETAGYRKLLDFKDRTTDNGLYNLNGTLTFFGLSASSPGTVFAPATSGPANAHLVVTRDAGGTFNAYVNGVIQFSVADGGQGSFTGPGSIIHFLRDEGGQGVPGENPSGFLDYVRLYDAVLTQDDVSARFQGRDIPFSSAAAAPEPGTLALLGAGVLFGGAGMMRRRRQRNAF